MPVARFEVEVGVRLGDVRRGRMLGVCYRWCGRLVVVNVEVMCKMDCGCAARQGLAYLTE